MLNVSCVWWIRRIVNSQLRKSALESQLNCGLRFGTTRSICGALHKRWTSQISEGSHRVLHLTAPGPVRHLQQSKIASPPAAPSNPTNPLTPLQGHSGWAGAKCKMHEGLASSSVQFPNYQLERLPGLMCYRHQIIFQMGKDHSLQMEGEEAGRKKNLPITSLSSLSRPVILQQVGRD